MLLNSKFYLECLKGYFRFKASLNSRITWGKNLWTVNDYAQRYNHWGRRILSKQQVWVVNSKLCRQVSETCFVFAFIILLPCLSGMIWSLLQKGKHYQVKLQMKPTLWILQWISVNNRGLRKQRVAANSGRRTKADLALFQNWLKSNVSSENATTIASNIGAIQMQVQTRETKAYMDVMEHQVHQNEAGQRFCALSW